QRGAEFEPRVQASRRDVEPALENATAERQRIAATVELRTKCTTGGCATRRTAAERRFRTRPAAGNRPGIRGCRKPAGRSGRQDGAKLSSQGWWPKLRSTGFQSAG